MKEIILILMLLSFMWMTNACNARMIKPLPATQISLQSTDSINLGSNLLITAEGTVHLKRDSWSDFYPTIFGTRLHLGDLLRPVNNAKVAVLCSDLTLWEVPTSVPSGLANGCPPLPKPSIMRGDSRIGHTRGGSDPLIPNIISPRNTKLLSGTPMLRWNPISGVSTYTIRIRGQGLIWEKEVSRTEVRYPGVPPLQTEVNYLLIVEADNGRSSKDNGVGDLRFSILGDKKVQEIQDAARKLSDLQLPDNSKAFAMAQLYIAYGLISEAIDILEELTQVPSPNVAVYHTLGDLYQQIGLSRFAESRYLFALALEEIDDDIERQAIVHARLAEVYMTLGNLEKTIGYLTEARVGFEELGDARQVNELTEEILELIFQN